MRAEIWGGPHDGQILEVPPHTPFIRIPVPGQTITSFDPDANIRSVNMPIAIYARCEADCPNRMTHYVYRSQEVIS